MNKRSNSSRRMIMTVLASLTIVGVASSVYAQTTTCVTTFTPSCGYHLPNGVFYYTAQELVHAGTGKVIPPGTFYNPITGEFFRVGDVGAGGATTTVTINLGIGAGSQTGSTTTINSTNNIVMNSPVVNQSNYPLVVNYTVDNVRVVNNDDPEDYEKVSLATTATSSGPVSLYPGVDGMGGGFGAPGAPNAGVGGEMGLTLFNLLSSAILMGGAATYIIRNSITLK